MCPLQGLIELLRVTEQDQTPCGRGDGDGVRKRDLARLVDDEHVERSGEVLTRPDPGGAADHVELAALKGFEQVWVGLEATGERAGGVAMHFGLLPYPNRHPTLAGLLRDLVEQVADHLVAVRGDADLAAGGGERQDHLCARVGLAGPGRTLDRQCALVESHRHADGDLGWIVATLL